MKKPPANPAAFSQGGHITSAKLGAKGRKARAQAGAAARHGRKFRIQAQNESGAWTDDGLGDNPPCSLRECREGIAGLLRLGGEWARPYRIVDATTGAAVE